jgi:putative transposase
MLSLTTAQRDELLTLYRKDADPELRFRAHIILLLGDGHPWDTIEATLFCSSRTVDRWLKRFQAEGVAGLTGRKRGRPFRVALGWLPVLAYWVTAKVPADFGFLRSRWSCAVLAFLLHERHGVAAGRETIRRLLHRGDLVYRRPRPVPPPNEEQRRTQLAELRRLLEGLPADETAVWQDEVEVNTNPEIGRMWMLKGRQATVQTPGTNRKRHLAGSMHWRTAQVFLTEAAPKQGRDSSLFVKHLDDLRRRRRRYKKIHVICDNAGFHTRHEVIE